ncbi:MAG TPA: hypothetical protein VIR77_02300, partial [Pontiella sp.]
DEGQRILGADIQCDMPSAVLIDLSSQFASGGNYGGPVAAPYEFTIQFDYSALNAALVQFRYDLNNMHEGKLAVWSWKFEVVSGGLFMRPVFF